MDPTNPNAWPPVMSIDANGLAALHTLPVVDLREHGVLVNTPMHVGANIINREYKGDLFRATQTAVGEVDVTFHIGGVRVLAKASPVGVGFSRESSQKAKREVIKHILERRLQKRKRP